MHGREKFYYFRVILKLCTWLFSYTPDFLKTLLWSWLDIGRGNLSIGLRYALLKNLASECGDVVNVGPNVEIHYPENLEVGSNVSIRRSCYIDAYGGVRIGSDVSIAHQSSILSFEYRWDNQDLPIRDNPREKKQVVIGNDVWIGCGVRILAGVHIGSRCIVGAGSVVTKDLIGNAIYVGVPARKLMDIP